MGDGAGASEEGRAGVVVQARTGSRRLPGKVLADLGGSPLLGRLLDRMVLCREVDVVVVATSTAQGDDAVADLCARRGVACTRGPEDDVAERFLRAAGAHDLAIIVRVSGDSPLLDPALVDLAARELRRTGADLVSNVAPRTHPHGQSVEAFRVAALRGVLPLMTGADREHVTPALHRAPGVQRRPLPGAPLRPDLSLTVDTPADLERVRAVVAAMERPPETYGLPEVVDLWERIVAGAAA